MSDLEGTVARLEQALKRADAVILEADCCLGDTADGCASPGRIPRARALIEEWFTSHWRLRGHLEARDVTASWDQMRAREAEIMRDFERGVLTRFGVAQLLIRAGFRSQAAAEKANSLPKKETVDG